MLSILDLKYTKVTDVGLQHLSGLRMLSTLNLIYTKVTDVDLQHLSGFSMLEIII